MVAFLERSLPSANLTNISSEMFHSRLVFILQFSLQGRKKSRTEDLSNDDENAGEQEEEVEGGEEAEEEDDGRRAINYTVSCLNSYDVCLLFVFGRIALYF